VRRVDRDPARLLLGALSIDSNDRTATLPLLRFANVIVIAAVNDVFPWST
jgi:hypothetical protein